MDMGKSCRGQAQSPMVMEVIENEGKQKDIDHRQEFSLLKMHITRHPRWQST